MKPIDEGGGKLTITQEAFGPVNLGNLDADPSTSESNIGDTYYNTVNNVVKCLYSDGVGGLFWSTIGKNIEIEKTQVVGTAVTLADSGTITSAMIGNTQVTQSKLATSAVTNAKVATNADIDPTKIAGTAVTLTSGTAVYATTAGTAVYATSSATSGTATYSTTSGTATYATDAGTAVYGTNAGTAVYATTSGTATYSTNSGTATYATTSGTATYATTAGTATYATNAGTAVNISGTIAATQVTGTAITVQDLQYFAYQPASVIETIPRFSLTTSTVTNGELRLIVFTPIVTTTISNIVIYVATGGTDTGGTTTRRMGLYTVSGRNYTLVARTASDATIGNSNSTAYSRALNTTGGFPATYTLNAGSTYAIGALMYNTGGTFASPSFQVGVVNAVVSTQSPRMADAVLSQTDISGDVTGTSNTGALLYARLT